MLRQSLFQRRQLRLPSLFLLMMAIAFFLVASIWIAWQLYAHPYDDLPTFYWATRIVFEQGFSVYQPAPFLELGEALNRKIYPFLYPPPSLLLFAPVLLCVDYEQCKIIFSVWNLLLWWGLVWVLYRFYLRSIGEHPKQALMGILLLLFFTLAYMPITDTLKNGQVNLIVLLCLMPTLFAPVGRCQQVLAGSLLACAIIMKVYVLLLLLVMLMFGRWREVKASVIVLVFLVIVSVALLPDALWQDWFEMARHAGYGKGIPQLLTIPFNQSINGFFIRYFLEHRGVGQPMDWVLWIYGVVLVCVIFVMYAILKYLKHVQQGDSVALALVLLLINLIAPLTWLHHYVFALPAIVWSVVLLQQAPRTWLQNVIAVMLLLASGVLAAPYVVAWGFAGTLSQLQFEKGMGVGYNLILSTSLVSAMMLFIIFLFLIFKRN